MSHLFCSMSFLVQKLAIDTNRASHKTSVRGERLSEMVQEVQISQYVVVSNRKADVKKERNSIKKEFEASLDKTGFDIDHYNQINQGADGACTLVSLFNLIHLSGLDQEIHEKSWAKINHQSYWQTRCWNPIFNKSLEYSDDGPRYFADTLDFGVELSIKAIQRTVSDVRFRYVPIRGDAMRELNVNSMFFTPSAVAAAQTRFGENYNRGMVTCCVGNFIESTLDAGNPVAISFNGHARVAVAYNQAHLLFADSWDNSIMELVANGELYVAGVSIVPKYAVYMYAKDVVYFDQG